MKVNYLITTVINKDKTEIKSLEPMYSYRYDKNVYKNDYKYFSFYVYSYQFNVFSDTLKLPSYAEIWR